MQCLVSHLTGEPPELVYSSRITDVGQGNKALGQVPGVSAAKSHHDARGECLTSFARHFGGRSPLVPKRLSEVRDIFWIRLASLIFWR